jgi:hypothetical protein
MRCIYEIWYMSGWEKDEKEGAKDKEEKKDAEMRTVKDGGEGPSWKECEHEGESKGGVSLSGPALNPRQD